MLKTRELLLRTSMNFTEAALLWWLRIGYLQLETLTKLLLLTVEKSLKLEIILRSLKREVHIIIWSRISLNLEIEKLNINNIKIMT